MTMKGHVAPHRWADAFAGRLDDDERAEIDAHADRCRACARARDRIKLASGSFPALRAMPPPEIAWDHVRARVHWSVSSERRDRRDRRDRMQRSRAKRWTLLAVGVGAAAVAGAIATGSIDPRASQSAAPVAETASSKQPAVVERAAPLAGLVSRAAGEIMVDGIRSTDLFERELGPGSVLATGDGKVDVQFGDASAFGLGPRSTLDLRKFDAKSVELAVVGVVDVEVAARAADQRFVVVAGTRTIEVRGTQFRVFHDDKQTEVVCKHGLVVVRDPSGDPVAVSGGRKLVIRAHDAISSTHTIALTADELTALAPPVAMPVWTPELAKSSAALEVATSGHRDVRVDGIELGAAPLRVRVMAGRHTVEAEDSAGRFRPAGWVDVGAKPARLDVPTEVVPTGGIAERKRQLLAGIDRNRLASCTRRIAKQGLSGTYVQFAISVDTSGAVGFLNVIGSDLPSSAQACVKAVLQDVHFVSGPTATWRDRLDL